MNDEIQQVKEETTKTVKEKEAWIERLEKEVWLGKQENGRLVEENKKEKKQ
ncbi:hypothetical protein [Bacillus sp. CDB3]|uniref:hypothetical protein n=1 Tax=Bacillus sp. CDB3 TaxID=360310 RepID=UPI0015C43273|nr:hypothetical protein [Bacillus sp. CDB3]